MRCLCVRPTKPCVSIQQRTCPADEAMSQRHPFHPLQSAQTTRRSWLWYMYDIAMVAIIHRASGIITGKPIRYLGDVPLLRPTPKTWRTIHDGPQSAYGAAKTHRGLLKELHPVQLCTRTRARTLFYTHTHTYTHSWPRAPIRSPTRTSSKPSGKR